MVSNLSNVERFNNKIMQFNTLIKYANQCPHYLLSTTLADTIYCYFNYNVGADELFSRFSRPSSPHLQTGLYVGCGPNLEPVRENTMM